LLARLPDLVCRQAFNGDEELFARVTDVLLRGNALGIGPRDRPSDNPRILFRGKACRRQPTLDAKFLLLRWFANKHGRPSYHVSNE